MNKGFGCYLVFVIFRIWEGPLLKANSVLPNPSWLQLLSIREDTPCQPDSQVTPCKHPLMLSLSVQGSRLGCISTAIFELVLHKLNLARQKLLVFENTNVTISWVLNSTRKRNKSTSLPSLLPSRKAYLVWYHGFLLIKVEGRTFFFGF